MFGSEFSINAEIYGYKFDDNGLWYHEEQKLDFTLCKNIAKNMSKSIEYKNKVADFQVITYLNLGIDLQDILRYNEKDLRILYNIPKLNENKLTMYKQMIGAT